MLLAVLPFAGLGLAYKAYTGTDMNFELRAESNTTMEAQTEFWETLTHCYISIRNPMIECNWSPKMHHQKGLAGWQMPERDEKWRRMKNKLC